MTPKYFTKLFPAVFSLMFMFISMSCDNNEESKEKKLYLGMRINTRDNPEINKYLSFGYDIFSIDEQTVVGSNCGIVALFNGYGFSGYYSINSLSDKYFIIIQLFNDEGVFEYGHAGIHKAEQEGNSYYEIELNGNDFKKPIDITINFLQGDFSIPDGYIPYIEFYLPYTMQQVTDIINYQQYWHILDYIWAYSSTEIFGPTKTNFSSGQAQIMLKNILPGTYDIIMCAKQPPAGGYLYQIGNYIGFIGHSEIIEPEEISITAEYLISEY